MELNAEFDQSVQVVPQHHKWVKSPMPGVERMMLDRLGDEVARATTIVRYAPGSAFSSHTHDGGEEFIVLEGVFEDEHGAFPVGSYIRNPPGSSHTPSAPQGAVIFVKLWQFDPEDRSHVRIDTKKLGSVADEQRKGVRISPLFEDAREKVSIEIWDAGTGATIDAPGGAEILILEGNVISGGERLDPWSWVRRPVGEQIDLTAGVEGARLWIKTGHLNHVSAPGA
ncbi:cupin domain-containing protein [uncultured Roseibium sp.]|uniref:cupin domain-containing protein n=1 Tax=uncultured Roseibium sp. TaxID=1936171 RepID=UPI00261B6CF4|nr:cupin domain-containing protein [uncultured Roseibium sp.]